MMEYKNEKKPLLLREYGRYVQEMVEHLLTVEDKKERSEGAETLMQVMTQLNPQYKGNDELQQKLWDDLHIMSDFKLDIDGPYPLPERKEDIVAEKIAYPSKEFRYKHYGHIVDQLIAEAVKLDEGEEQQELTQMIANLMKRNYLNYNRDSVNEQMIIDQLAQMSGGKLKLDKDFEFIQTSELIIPQKKTSTRSGRKKRKWKGKKN